MARKGLNTDCIVEAAAELIAEKGFDQFSLRELADRLGACQGIGYGFHHYAGPKPPKGKKHIYRFTIYSLDCEMNISANSMKRIFLKKAEKHIIQKGSVVGEFG